MKKRVTEQAVLFASIIKWAFLSACIGVIVGGSTAVFLKLLHSSTSFAGRYQYYFLSLPLAMLLSTLLVKYLAPDAEGHGTEKVIEAVHRQSGRIKASVVPVKLAATIVTIAAGGSAGKEGPCAQIGAGLASVFADIFRFNDLDRKKLAICGISAGFATVFGTPIAGAIFGTEVLFVGSILYEVLMPSFIAGIVGFQVSSSLGITYFYHPISFVPVFSESFFITVLLAGVFFGVCSFLLVEVLKLGETLSRKSSPSKVYRSLIGGLVLIILTLTFSKDYLGLGIDTIEAVLSGAETPWYAFIVKSVFTSITLSFGGSGGILTPIFFIGSTAGNLFAQITGLDLATFSAIGLVSVLAGAANTPIAASIMSMELFGPKIAPYAAVSCVISFLMTGHRSVYPSQILATVKSAAISVETGTEMEKVSPEIRPEAAKTAKRAMAFAGKVKKKVSDRDCQRL